MNFKEMLEKRHACKLFDGRKIPEEDLKFILESGVLAPSSHGFEPWKFLVIKDAKKKRRIKPHSKSSKPCKKRCGYCYYRF